MASPRLMLCGVMSGSGKTTVTCGLLQTLVNPGPPDGGLQMRAGLHRSHVSRHGDWSQNRESGWLLHRSGAPPVSPGQGVGGDGYFHSGGGDGLL